MQQNMEDQIKTLRREIRKTCLRLNDLQYSLRYADILDRKLWGDQINISHNTRKYETLATRETILWILMIGFTIVVPVYLH